MADYQRSPVEREANEFAANLLMPKAMFARVIAGQAPSIAVALTASERFGTSLTATVLRLA